MESLETFLPEAAAFFKAGKVDDMLQEAMHTYALHTEYVHKSNMMYTSFNWNLRLLIKDTNIRDTDTASRASFLEHVDEHVPSLNCIPQVLQFFAIFALLCWVGLYGYQYWLWSDQPRS